MVTAYLAVRMQDADRRLSEEKHILYVGFQLTHAAVSALKKKKKSLTRLMSGTNHSKW